MDNGYDYGDASNGDANGYANGNSNGDASNDANSDTNDDAKNNVVSISWKFKEVNLSEGR